MLKRLLIFLLIMAVIVGCLLLFGLWRDRDSLTTSWSWYRSPQFKYRLQYPPGWIIGPSPIMGKEETQIYIVSPEDKQEEDENAAICAGEKVGICAPEMPPSGVFIEVIEKPKDIDLDSWLKTEYGPENISYKENFKTRILEGLRIETTNDFYGEFAVFLIQPSYILKVNQYLEETPELELVAKSVQLPEEREMVGGGIYYFIFWGMLILITYYATRIIVGKKNELPPDTTLNDNAKHKT